MADRRPAIIDQRPGHAHPTGNDPLLQQSVKAHRLGPLRSWNEDRAGSSSTAPAEHPEKDEPRPKARLSDAGESSPLDRVFAFDP